MIKQKLNVSQLMDHLSLEVNIVGIKTMKIKIFIAVKLITLASMILGTQLKIDYDLK